MNFNEYSDAELYKLLFEDKSTSERAFKEIYARYAKNVLSYLKHFLKSEEDAEDAFQETFVRFYASKQLDRKITNLVGYLVIIARNVAYNHLRDSTTIFIEYEEYFEKNEEHKIEDIESTVDSEIIGKYIDDAISELSDVLKEVFILREIQGFSYNDIVEITNQTLDVVRTRIHRAKKQVRDYLEDKLKITAPLEVQKEKW